LGRNQLELKSVFLQCVDKNYWWDFESRRDHSSEWRRLQYVSCQWSA